MPRHDPLLDSPPSHDALNALFERVYGDLRRLAHHLRRQGAPGEYRTTGLVHEAYLKLARSPSRQWKDQRHFIRLAGRAMRQLLMDAAAARRAAKRGGDAEPVTLTTDVGGTGIDLDALLDLDRALERLTEVDERAARVLELRFFVGLSVEETAEVLEVSAPTVKRDWRTARAWVRKELQRR